MFNWFKSKKSSQQQLMKKVDENPATKLIKVVRISDHRSVQVLELKNQYYLLEKSKGEKQSIQQVQDASLQALIKNRLLTSERLQEFLNTKPEKSKKDKKAKASEPTPTPPASSTVKQRQVTASQFEFTIDDNPFEELPKAAQSPVPTPSVEMPPPKGLVNRLTDAMNEFNKNNPEAMKDLKEKPKPVKKAVKKSVSQHDFIIPPPKHLVSRMTDAMSTFADNNPDAISVLHLDENLQRVKQKGISNYMDSSTPGGGSATSSPESTPTTFSSHAQMPTRKPVTRSLDTVIQTQKERLHQVKQMQHKIEQEKIRFDALLNKQQTIDAKTQEIEQYLSHFVHQSQLADLPEESVLQKTDLELQDMETTLNQILTNGSVLKRLLENNQEYASQIAGHDKPLDSIVNSLNQVAQQRRLVNQLKHKRQHHEVEKERVMILIRRKRDIEVAIQELKQVLEQIESANNQILELDPFAVIEPVPATAENELKRLEFELQLVSGDPGVTQFLAESSNFS